ncbi:MAG: proteasome subunit beta [Actinobacteria bacterium]|nr:proteasome subunit beta [Actinomycetota bacterium]
MRDFSMEWTRAAFSTDANPSFSDLLSRVEPNLLPSVRDTVPQVPHATTIVALRFADGIVMAGDRRATEGYQIADRRIEKVYAADEFSAVAIAGAAGPAMDMVKLFQTELEHYEKVEGDMLSLEGKANKLAQLIKANFPMAMQGLVVVPLFGGFDARRSQGRIFRYDAVGGRYEELDYHATGSGGKDARSALRTSYRPDLARDDAVRAAVEALLIASEEDTATGGPDLIRGIFPTVSTVTAKGFEMAPDTELRAIVEALMAARAEQGGIG